MNYTSVIKTELSEAAQVLDQFMSNQENLNKIDEASDLIVQAIKSGGKVISCGNGGSHCDAMHFAEELTGRYRGERRSLPGIAISDASHITCAANDYGFEHIFSRFVEGMGFSGDVLLGISTSGNSDNIINALSAAKKKGMKTIVLSGKNGGKLADMADLEIRVPHFGFSDRIQEVHIKIIHVLILLIEQKMEVNAS